MYTFFRFEPLRGATVDGCAKTFEMGMSLRNVSYFGMNLDCCDSCSSMIPMVVITFVASLIRWKFVAGHGDCNDQSEDPATMESSERPWLYGIHWRRKVLGHVLE